MAGAHLLFKASSLGALAALDVGVAGARRLVLGMDAVLRAVSSLPDGADPSGFLRGVLAARVAWAHRTVPPVFDTAAVLSWASQAAFGPARRSAVPDEPLRNSPWRSWADSLGREADQWWRDPAIRDRAAGILGSHLHMTCNRLGLAAADETALIAVALSRLSGRPASLPDAAVSDAGAPPPIPEHGR